MFATQRLSTSGTVCLRPYIHVPPFVLLLNKSIGNPDRPVMDDVLTPANTVVSVAKETVASALALVVDAGATALPSRS